MVNQVGDTLRLVVRRERYDETKLNFLYALRIQLHNVTTAVFGEDHQLLVGKVAPYALTAFLVRKRLQ